MLLCAATLLGCGETHQGTGGAGGPRGAIERWRFVLATNALAYGLRIQGADARVIATDGGLLPAPFALDRVEILSYFENPGRWMVHCHISEHSENGMMADIQVGEPSADHSH